MRPHHLAIRSVRHWPELELSMQKPLDIRPNGIENIPPHATLVFHSRAFKQDIYCVLFAFLITKFFEFF